MHIAQFIPRLLATASGKVLAVAIPVYLLVAVQMCWIGDDGQGWKQIHRSDVKGYYGYLLSTVIRGDLGNEEYDVRYIHETDNGTLNKYFIGTSVLMAPWFAVGHALASAYDLPQDGEQAPYLISIGFGAIVYAFIGLFLFRRLLYYLKLDEALIAWIIAALTFGTILLQYTSMQPGWTHVYSFCAIASFFYCLTRVEQSGAASKELICASAFLALLLLIRPVNGLILLGVPVIFGTKSWKLLRQTIANRRGLLLAIIVGFLILAIQPFFWWLQTGNWIEWSYRNEGFHWTRPEFIKVWLSMRRGLFVYTPVLLLFLASLLVLFKHDRFRGLWATVYFLANSYVISAWWIWDYGGGFGQRPFIDHYPILFLVMALGVSHLKPLLRKFAYAFLAICTVFSILQWIQYQQEIIAHEYMNSRKYAHVFMKFGEEYRNCLGGVDHIPPYHPMGMERVFTGANKVPADNKEWILGRSVEKPFALSAPNVCELNPTVEYSMTFRVSAAAVPPNQALFLYMTMGRYNPVVGASDGALIVVAIDKGDGANTYYNTYALNPIKRSSSKSWETLKMSFELPPLQTGEFLSVYVWNKEKSTFYLDDFSAELFSVNPY